MQQSVFQNGSSSGCMVIPMTINDDNLYAAPTAGVLLKPGATHHEFQFTNKGIRCRSGLELPKICLVTGRTDDLVPHSFRLMWLPMISRAIVFCALFIMLTVPFGLYLLNRYFPHHSVQSLQRIQNMKLLPITWITIFQVVVFFGIIMSPRCIVTAHVHGSVRSRIRKRIWMTAIIAVLGIAICGVSVVFLVRLGEASIALMFAIMVGFLFWIIAAGTRWRRRKKTRFDWNALKLKVISCKTEQFEITGFAPQFLDALQKYRSDSDL